MAVDVPEEDGSGGSSVNKTLAIALSLSLFAVVVVAAVLVKFVTRRVRRRAYDMGLGRGVTLGTENAHVLKQPRTAAVEHYLPCFSFR